jgi:hypothetical protein
METPNERSRYRRELKAWSKNELVREVERLRAIIKEHAYAPGEDTADVEGGMVDPVGDPFARGGVIIDARNAILLEELDVSLVDRDSSSPISTQHLLLAMVLAGRVNMRNERRRVLFMLGVDGAAAIVSELIALAERIGPEFRDLLLERMSNIPRPPDVR